MTEKLPMKIWRVLYPILLYFALSFFVSFIVEVVLGLMPSNKSLTERVTEFAGITQIIYLAISIIVMYFVYKNTYVRQSDYIFKHPIYIPVIFLMGIFASHGLSALVSCLNLDNILGSYSNISNTIFSYAPVVVIISTVILAPVSEELVFRGIVFNRLRDYTGFWASAIISSVLFGVYHFNLAQGLFAFLYGILLCLVYEKFKNLFANMFMHAAGNLIAVVITYTGFDYPEYWMVPAVGAAAVLAACALYYFVIRKAETV